MEVKVFMYRSESWMSISRPAWLLSLVLTVAACGGGEKGAGAFTPHESVMRLVVNGLPADANARVRLTLPNGESRQYTGSATVTGLAAGTYGVAAGYVNAAGQTFTASLASGSVTLAEGDSSEVAITYVGGPATTLNLSVGYVQLIQSTQRTDGSIPMIANRDVLLRVFVRAGAANSAQPGVRVRLFQGSAQVDSLLVAAPGTAVPTAVDTGSIGASWNILIPGARVVAGSSIQVEIDPDDLVPETDKANNRWPGGSAVAALDPRAVPPFALRFVPVRITANATTGAVNSGNRDSLARVTRVLFPLSQMTVSVRSTFTTDAQVLQSDDANHAWGQILSEMSALRGTDNNTSNYVGMVPTTYSSGIAGLGYIGAPASVAWDKTNSAPGVIAHEVGHNFGRNHAPCGGPSGVDGSYPYPGALIGSWGIDIGSLAIKAPGTTRDLMSYCDPDWVSDYTYLGVASYRDAHAIEQAALVTEATEGLLIWGRVVQGNVILEPAIRVQAASRLPQRAGTNRIEGFDDNGQRLFGLSFDGDLVADLPGGEERHFAYVVPLTASEQGRLASLTLTGRGLTARRTPAPALRGSAVLPTPQAVRDGGTVRWDATYPMAVVRDVESGEVVAFGRGGATSFDNGGKPVRVELLDGVRSRTAVVVTQ